MMTREMVMELLATAGRDLDFDDCDETIYATVYDFIGFDDNWSEISRDLDDAELVASIYRTLEAEVQQVDGDFYRYFHFDGFTVCWGYASFDI